jgi:hypothetical protein
MASLNKCTRSGVGNTISFCCYEDMIIAGLRNGALKCIDVAKKECSMLESCSLDEAIVFVNVYIGNFCGWHPMCGGLHPVKTDPQCPFYIGYSSKKLIYIWCGRCLSQFCK